MLIVVRGDGQEGHGSEGGEEGAIAAKKRLGCMVLGRACTCQLSIYSALGACTYSRACPGLLPRETRGAICRGRHLRPSIRRAQSRSQLQPWSLSRPENSSAAPAQLR
ncbi:hypothetical protein CUC08_Gglean004057 [Alternaria sp. MG1]|nr:hypothetical protein CUC08_Gglean004057 [Alternaria sp. MG1]